MKIGCYYYQLSFCKPKVLRKKEPKTWIGYKLKFRKESRDSTCDDIWY